MAVVDQDVLGSGRDCPGDRGIGFADHEVDRSRVAGVARPGRTRVVDARDALHVDAQVDPHHDLLGTGSRLVTDPDVAVGEPLGLPDRGACLRLVDGIARRVEGRVPVRRDGYHRDRRLARAAPHRRGGRWPADRRRTGPRSRRRSSPGSERQRVERLVLERIDGPPGVAGGLLFLARCGRPGRRARPPEEADDRTVLGYSERIGELGQDGRAERRLAQLEDPGPGRGPGPSSPVPLPPETGGIMATSSPSASGVVGSA